MLKRCTLAIAAATATFAVAACTSVDAQSEPPSSAAATGPAGAADGVLPDKTSAFDTDLPGISKLDPELLNAVQKAETAMRQDGITMHVNTGWRSKKYQEELLTRAIAKYGSKKKALEYVATPEDSHHVTGDAVDIGPTAADYWLIRKGARFGLCQTLSHEIWHFELVTTPGDKCPPMG
ncbi:M15 family metallopeptidase [Kribbella sp. NPDC050124]|uniref:M15 family metallopeptidase n=1 Tax=Kribbella sp. NPDC050124 TaxID=3364114 RepID=UPI0037B7C6F3